MAVADKLVSSFPMASQCTLKIWACKEGEETPAALWGQGRRKGRKLTNMITPSLTGKYPRVKMGQGDVSMLFGGPMRGAEDF
jgi:hypothetical protein